MDMAKTVERSERELSSAEIIRELRGPLPEDDPDMVLENGQYVPRCRAETSPEHREAVEAVLRDLQALPKGTLLTMEEVVAFTRRLPRRPSDWTSADVIRESRGPLPEDDPEYQRNHGHRR